MGVSMIDSKTIQGIKFGLGLSLGAGIAAFIFNVASQFEPEKKSDRPYDHILTDRVMDQIEFSESSMNPNAVNPRTKVKGPFQFKLPTALEQFYKHPEILNQFGENHGRPNLASSIIRSTGKNAKKQAIYIYSVKGKHASALIDAAIRDRDVSRQLAKNYMADGLAKIENLPNNKIRLSPEIAYKVHHFGHTGAMKIIETLNTSPRKAFVSVVGKDTCASNPAICYKNGKALSVQQVSNLLAAKLENAPEFEVR